MLQPTPILAKKVIPKARPITAKSERHVSSLPNFIKLLSKSPVAMNAYVQATRALANGRLNEGEREILALAVAEINGSDYCLAAHESAAREAGLTEEDVSLACKASAKNPRSEAMLHFVQAIVLQRGDIKEEETAAIRKAGFSEAEIIEVVANIGLNIFTNYLNILSRTNLDSPAVHPEKTPAGKVPIPVY